MDVMDKITEEAVEQARTKLDKTGDLETKRICFATTHATALTKEDPPKKPGYFGAFNVPFGGGFKRLFPLPLFSPPQDDFYVDSYWRSIRSKEEFEEIKKWMERQGERVFLRDCLYASIAMSHNLKDVKPNSDKTEIGKLEYQAKQNRNKDAIKALAMHSINTIKDFPLYNEADLVCAVPSTPDKEYDLPAEIVSIVSDALDKDDITQGFSFDADKESITDAPEDEKWEIWENAELTFNGSLTDKTIILIDDKYQSGITIQYVAMKLQEAGASRVLGLCMVKTMKDDDNQ